MRVNDKELIATSFKPSTIEGRINYKVVLSGKIKGSSFKEYWFKLIGNLLFYFSLNSFGGIKGNVSKTVVNYIFCTSPFWSFINYIFDVIQEPVGVMVLENMKVSFDEEGVGIFAFVIQYAGEPEKHIFSCFSINQAQNWVIALRQARYGFVFHSSVTFHTIHFPSTLFFLTTA